MCSNGTDGGCAVWWRNRSYADARTSRSCADPHSHDEHLWSEVGHEPPLPFTMWVCAGRPTCASGVAETDINEDPCVTCGRSGTCNIFFCYQDGDR